MMQKILSQHGANRVSIDYNDDGDPIALTFQMTVNGHPLWLRIEPDPEGMFKAMKEDDDIEDYRFDEEQARRTAWKNKHDWLDAQLAEVASNQAEMEELFLGFSVTDNGETVYERLKRNDKLLEAGSSSRP